MDEQQKTFFIKVVVVSLILGATAGFLAGGLGYRYLNKNLLPVNQSQSEIKVINQQDQVVVAVKQADPAVVSIIITKDLPVIQQRNPFDFWPFGDFFGQPSDTPTPQPGTQKQEIGGGSGFIISSDGMILTNKHVVSDTSADYTVLTNDGQKYPAKVLALDPVQDIAVIKIDKNNLPTLKLGDSDQLQIGQTAIAIGNALGEFRNTVSVGVVSGLERSISASSGGLGASSEQLGNVIQTDAAINPGNSGGPLLNLSGEVIGMNIAVAQGAQNIGFALPINFVKKDIDQVKKSGKISYPFLGIRYTIITKDLQQKNNLSVDYGALIVRGQTADELAIISDSPADKAGLRENDIILEFNGQKIDTDHALGDLIVKYNIGDTVTLRVLSAGKEKTVKVTLEERK